MDFIQTSITQDHAVAVEGMLADCGFHDVISGMCASRKLLSIAVGASNSQVYTITINGVAFVYTADASATTAEIVLGLKALINAGTEPVLASGVDTPLLLESTLDGVDGDFTYSASAGTGTLVETVVVEQGLTLLAGKFVCFDERSTDHGPVDYPVRKPRQATDITGGLRAGVLLSTFSMEQLPASNALYSAQLAIPGNSMVDVLQEGRVWVKVEQPVEIGDAAFVRFAAGAGGTVLGSFRKDADTASAAQHPNARYKTRQTVIGGLAVLEMND